MKANEIINSLHICDPAVGSGHFLVSALNEIIAIKAELGILADDKGNIISGYEIEILNDELIITDTKGNAVEYKLQHGKPNKETQRLQKTLFHEKQTLIENCLFGVDINPKSVLICRLRLWIELLKNAYYKEPDFTELETLPNIDINIKCGNSLLSRFLLDADLSKALKSIKHDIKAYRGFVNDYKNEKSRDVKRGLQKIIDTIKNDFRTEIGNNDPKYKRLQKLQLEFWETFGGGLFGENKTSKDDMLKNKEKIQKGEKRKSELEAEINKLSKEIDQIKTNSLYKNAFEWRFEFPEVVNNDGNFEGFDLILGNPPYIQLQTLGKDADALTMMNYKTYARMGDIYSLFYEKGNDVLKKNGFLSFITSNKWMRAGYGESTRKYFSEYTNPLLLIDFSGQKVFEDVTVDTNILMFQKAQNANQTQASVITDKFTNNLTEFVRENSSSGEFNTHESWVILNPIEQKIKEKIDRIGVPLKDWDISINYGIKTGFNDAFIISGETKNSLIKADPKSAEIIRPILRGRDIKRYAHEFADLWLLFIPWHFPLHKDATIIGASQSAEQAFKDLYPAIYSHLLKYKLQLSNRNKAETGIRYEWYALQRWGANYWEDFSKQKIVWGEISDKTKFCLDIEGDFVCEATTFLMTGTSLVGLLCYLNSSLSEYLFAQIGTTTGVGTVRWKKFTIEQLKIPKELFLSEKKAFETIGNQIILQKKSGKDVSTLEKEIDQLIYKAFDFTEREIKVIERK